LAVNERLVTTDSESVLPEGGAKLKKKKTVQTKGSRSIKTKLGEQIAAKLLLAQKKSTLRLSKAGTPDSSQ